MQPTIVALDEVVVSNKGERFITDFVGYKNFGEKTFGYWKDNKALGGELATCILAKKGIRKLDRFNFEVKQISNRLYFDVWYNALLSAQHQSKVENRKTSVIDLLTAAIIGKLSFLHGLINPLKTSSPIYICQRK